MRYNNPLLKMNQLKNLMYLCKRGYRSHGPRRVNTPRILHDVDDSKTEKTLYPNIKDSDIEIDEDYTDPDFNEPDFTLAHKSYDEHMRESYVQKQKLKGRIVAQKLFKSDDPNFVTWAERELMRKLHLKDSEEWSPEQLSESFPALPRTIKKILKSKWFPRSTESVVNYDEKVVENWNQFKAGNLNLDPQLAKHLEKFKGRKINIEELKQIAKNFVRPPRVFPKPKSKIFTSIVQDYVEATKAKDGNDPPKITDGKNKINKKSIVDMTLFLSSDKFNKQEKYKTYDKFLEENAIDIVGKQNLNLEEQLLVNEYKEQKNRASVSERSITHVSVENEEKSLEMSNTSTEAQVTTVPVPKFDINESSMETGILEWKKKELGTDDNHPRFIKVPRSKANSGVTFKVKDCYYDSDGEFMYKVPGLRS
ncbi:uncharacterized protein LOC141524230 isoform X2 [Cotesia typhae]|uniref:uncharacterized protein LOC141524230 isoform X2 n=1 Tax=Cotesia typhae TaxID=2053667 RepID=UPI003D68FA70